MTTPSSVFKTPSKSPDVSPAPLPCTNVIIITGSIEKNVIDPPWGILINLNKLSTYPIAEKIPCIKLNLL